MDQGATIDKSSTETTTTTAGTTVVETTTIETTTATPAAPADSGEIGKCTIAIKDATITKDHSNEPVMIVNFDYTNNGDDAAAFIFAVSVTAYQDDVEAPSAVLISDDYDSEAQMKKIKPGATITVQQAFSITGIPLL